MKYNKRPFLLLEVLIAFALVIFCAIPLIAPHVDMYKAQRAWLDKEELDHVVNLLYANILEDLYTNKIEWSQLRSEYEAVVTPQMIREAGYQKPLYFDGKYKFTINKFKPKNENEFNLYLFDLKFTFLPTSMINATPEIKESKTIKYDYNIFVVRDLRTKESAPTQP